MAGVGGRGWAARRLGVNGQNKIAHDHVAEGVAPHAAQTRALCAGARKYVDDEHPLQAQLLYLCASQPPRPATAKPQCRRGAAHAGRRPAVTLDPRVR